MTDNLHTEVLTYLQSIDEYKKTKKLLEQVRKKDSALTLAITKTISANLKDN